MEITGLEDFLRAASERRIVLLGECSHDMREFYRIKAEIVRRLVEEHGFSLLVMEAGVASCAHAMRDGVEPLERLEGLYKFARIPEMLRLFEWAERSAPALRIVGMDPRVLRGGIEYTGEVAGSLGYPAASAVGEIEPVLDAVWRRMLLTGTDGSEEKEIARARVVLVEALEWLASRDNEELDARLLERILYDRLTLLDAMKTEAEYYDWRERRMAGNLEWWCDEIHPDAKVIVWGHNYHTMRRHSAINGERTMGEYLSEELMSDALSLGVYAHSGVGMYPDRKTFEVPPAPEGSIEHYGIADGEAARITLFAEQKGWWQRPCLSRLFGLEEEGLVPAEQYDGVLVVRDVTQTEFVDIELMRRMPL